MKRQVLAPILLGLLTLTTACSKSQPETPPASAASADDPLSTHMNCKPDDDTASSIATFETALANLRLRYGDDYPPLRSLRKNIQQLKERALGQCLAQERASPPSDEDPTAVLRNCDLDGTLDRNIRLTKARLDELRGQLPAGVYDRDLYPQPVHRNMVIAVSEAQVQLARLVQRGLLQCAKQTQKDSPAPI
jgi:hypothetical protein